MDNYITDFVSMKTYQMGDDIRIKGYTDNAVLISDNDNNLQSLFKQLIDNTEVSALTYLLRKTSATDSYLIRCKLMEKQ